MEGFLAGVGSGVITMKSLVYLSIISYVVIVGSGIYAAYISPKSELQHYSD